MDAKELMTRNERIKTLITRELQRTNHLPELRGKYVAVGIRNPNIKTDVFQDTFYLVKVKEDLTLDLIFSDMIGTTLPGKHFLLNPIYPRGTACVKEGFYKDVWTYGYHRNDKQHPALKQVGYFRLVLDSNKNDMLDAIQFSTIGCKEVKSFSNGIYYFNYYKNDDLVHTEIEVNNVGINQHRTNLFSTPTKVDVHSAGCQVIKSIVDYKPYMEYVFNTVAHNQQFISYLLIKTYV